ncbi:hypothetical protein PVK06_017990 [Gossypium arboreum]|uniref:DUF4371 domain-containing protein n=1 Tax=Gossypium arboreum TaxID=29729 RepID=A0ABR0Q4F3_GOSAR|nr:hypothetical protein PVK06_017990 [Gossypium arboreum]
MEFVSRFVDKEGFIRERFFDLVHVKDNTSLGLGKVICEVILHHFLNVNDIGDQGYDGARAISKEVILICQSFSYLIGIINLVAYSSKRHDQLRDIEASHVVELIDSGELETGKGKNQVSTHQHLGNTRWGSNLASLNSLMRMFNSICVVLQDIINSKSDGIYDAMTFIEFVFILHFMIEMLGIIANLYQALQYKS